MIISWDELFFRVTGVLPNFPMTRSSWIKLVIAVWLPFIIVLCSEHTRGSNSNDKWEVLCITTHKNFNLFRMILMIYISAPSTQTDIAGKVYLSRFFIFFYVSERQINFFHVYFLPDNFQKENFTVISFKFVYQDIAIWHSSVIRSYTLDV